MAPLIASHCSPSSLTTCALAELSMSAPDSVCYEETLKLALSAAAGQSA